MHDILAVHFLKSFQDAGNDLLYLIGLESILPKVLLIFDFISELYSLEILH